MAWRAKKPEEKKIKNESILEEEDNEEDYEEIEEEKYKKSKEQKKSKEDPKPDKIIVVNEIPTQQIRGYKADDGKYVGIITIDEALTAIYNEIILSD